MRELKKSTFVVRLSETHDASIYRWEKGPYAGFKFAQSN